MLSIIIPTYNEKDNILPLVSGITAGTKDCEVIFVDDNSPDGTAEQIVEVSKKYRNVKLVKRAGKLGLTSAVARGVDASSGERIIVMDADLSHPPERIPALSAGLDSADLVIGSRMIKGGAVKRWPIHRKILSKSAEILARVLIGVKTTDPLSGFFAVRKSVFKNTRLRTTGYKLLLNILADNPGIRVSEIPYVFSDRHAGKTKLGALEIFNYLADLVRIRFGKG